MDRPFIWVWGTFVGMSAGTLTFTGSVAAASAVGLASAACVWLATSTVAAHWRALVGAFSKAARGLPVESAHPALPELREVQTAAVTNSQNANKLTLLREALDTMSEGFWVTADDGTLLEHNLTARRLLQMPSEAIGRHPREFLTNVELLGAVEDACRNHRASSLTLGVSGMSARLRVQVAPLPRGHGSSAVFIPIDC